MATVSVIIPVFNRAGLLVQTLECLLAQTHKPHQIIVVDDGSSDHIWQVAEAYADRVLFLKNVGKGPGAARNRGLLEATGDYIQFFDSDDLMTRDKIELQVKALRETGADAAYGPYVMAVQEPDLSWRQTDVILQANAIGGGLNWQQALLRGWNIITQACMFRRTLVKSTPPWDGKLITHEDYWYLFEMSKLSLEAIHVPKGAVIYRQHANQSTNLNTNALSRTQDKLFVLQQIIRDSAYLRNDVTSKRFLRGRLYQTAHFLANNGDTNPGLQSFLQYPYKLDYTWYRIHNKYQRWATGTDWEQMHGPDASPAAYQEIISRLDPFTPNPLAEANLKQHA